MNWPEKKKGFFNELHFPLHWILSVKFMLISRKQRIWLLFGAFQQKWKTERECRSLHQTREKQRSTRSSVCFEPKHTDLYQIDQILFSFLGWPKHAPQDNVLTMVVSNTWGGPFWISAGKEIPNEETREVQVFTSTWPWSQEALVSMRPFFCWPSKTFFLARQSSFPRKGSKQPAQQTRCFLGAGIFPRPSKQNHTANCGSN